MEKCDIYNYSMIPQEQQLKILEAEGQLNREIALSLQEFREKITTHMSSVDLPKIQNEYDINKAGPEKLFKFRESLLTLMLDTKDFKTLYNMVVASFCVLTFCLVYDNYVVDGELMDMTAFLKFFRGAQTVFVSWWILVFCHFTIIPITYIAIQTSIKIWLPLYVLHLMVLIAFPGYISTGDHLGFASGFIIMCEGVRMLMKSHSYFRTKLLYIKPNQYKDFVFGGVKVNGQGQNDKKIKINMADFPGELRRLSYFFVAPTLIYRDVYTLTPIRSMAKIFIHSINFLACIYYSFMLYITLCKENIENLEKELDLNNFVITIIRLMMPSVFFLILGFFGFLHSWLNLWAEVTRFPDRAFYSDWWNSFQFGSYYRKWNIVVHDWLYYYIYVDFCRFFPICRKKRFLPKLSTFIISAIIHQIIICFGIGFFYPILFVLFTGPGIILIENQKRLKISKNLLFWLEMYVGTSLLFSCYLLEAFSRQRVDAQFMQRQWGYLAPIIPRTLYLGG